MPQNFIKDSKQEFIQPKDTVMFVKKTYAGYFCTIESAEYFGQSLGVTIFDAMINARLMYRLVSKTVD